MYQFTTTNVINSQYVKDYDGNDLLDSAGSQIAKVTGTSAGLNVPKVGNFKKANIVSIYKRPYAAGVKEVAVVRIPVITSGLVAKFAVVIKLAGSTQSEYVNYSLDFLKPITVEVLATGTAATDAAAIVAQLNLLKDRFGSKYFTAAVTNTDYVQITCKQYEQRVKSMVISKSAASYNSMIDPQYEDVSSTTFSVTTAGKLGFGDTNWMLRRVMLPTAENVRVFGISKDERPVLDGNYSEYVLRYSLDKDGTDGIVSGGKSVTTHVFYVISGEVSRFETAISNVGLTVPATLQAAATGNGTLSTGSDETDQLVWSGGVGAVTFSSDQPTRATVGATTGLVTTAGVTATGAVVITATDSVGNTDTVSYTIAT